jgi:ribosomal protein S18 acetylase RimI-like enzyme
VTPGLGGLTIRAFAEADAECVIALWARCDLLRPWNDPRKDIARKKAVNPEMFLIGIAGGRIVAALMAGYEGHRGSINYVAVDPDCRRRGYARRMMAAAEDLLRAAGCPKVNLMVREGNDEVIAFYKAIGYADNNVRCLGKRLEEDGPGDPSRTEVSG